MTVLMKACVAVALLPLISIMFEVVARGAPGLTVEFLTQLPRPVGEAGGGWGNAVQGTFLVVGLAALIGLPVGISAGIYMAEYGETAFTKTTRFLADMLVGVPSIVIGMAGYTLVVLTMGSFSAIAGGVALSFIMIPLVARTTEESLKLVPSSLREASLALGITRWRTILRVTLAVARAGVLTGIILALARISGETAPLLFTSFNSRFWATGLDQPVATLPVQIFTYGITGFPEWQAQAWTGSLLLVLLIFILSLTVRLLGRQRIK